VTIRGFFTAEKTYGMFPKKGFEMAFKRLPCKTKLGLGWKRKKVLYIDSV